jgi:hypothetical protein
MKRQIRFVSAGLVVYLISLWVLDDDRMWLVVFGTLVRLLVVVLPWGRTIRLWPLCLAVVYPYNLVLKTYAHRWDWAPEDWSIQLSSPTAFLIWMAAWLFLSILTAGWAVMKSAPTDVENEVRTLSKWLFGVTALGMVVSLPQISMKIFHYAAEPLAMAGYCWVMSKEPEEKTN